MKRFAAIAFVFVGFLSSCELLKREIAPETTTSGNTIEDINKWIHASMKDYYLWTDNMPVLDKTDLRQTPDQYFSSILYQKGEVDRFSWIQDDAQELKNSLNGINEVFGINYRSYYADADQTKIAFAITYTIKNSPAERAGLKRGDYITQVNGMDLTPSNFNTAFSPNTVTVTKGTRNSQGFITSGTETATMTKEVVTLDPIQHYSVLEMGGKKIGYFVYLQYLTAADKNMNEIFGEFKQKGVKELVVDLRYNRGGFISSSTLLSSLIVKGLRNNMLMSRQVWNDKQTKNYKERYGNNVFDDFFITSSERAGAVNNLGIERVYFLVSGSSASASELTINNLLPYMDVVMVGTNTFGKNVGSITLEDQSKRWNWAMQPIVLKTVNAAGNSDYGSKDGFTPNIMEAERLPFLPFGDPNEQLLNAALKHMLGENVVAQTGARKIMEKMSVVEYENQVHTDNPIMDRNEMYLDKLPGIKE